ncbi:hypothetical protein CRG98_017883 [Punica granatum]|uniref:RNase H type-1 domain-containing protein n=1 Tax=Punica granatum TaxID=22663 RepID=A0A2I0JZB6_PUNGR|nr:hypothetical protein CRG98_017883 [Punica granatum]
MEILSRLLYRAETNGDIKGIQISRGGLQITHLMFADDLLILTKATEANIRATKGILDKFCVWLGQEVNCAKSGLFFFKNTAADTRRTAKTIVAWALTKTNNNLAGRAIKAKYDNFLNTSNCASSTPIWKGLQWCKDTIPDSTCFSVGNCTTISAWLDPWIPGMNDHKPSPKTKTVQDPNLKISNDDKPLQAEARVALLALSIAVERGMLKIWLLSDALILIDAIWHPYNLPWEIRSIVSDIITSLKNFSEWFCSWISRDDNTFAHD